MFFDNILVYSKTLQGHVLHLTKVLSVMRQHQLYAKRTKCRFVYTEIDYLGHLISAHGVRADPDKITAMLEWPIPKNLKALRGFLGLTGYYRKFIQGYGKIAAPLTQLLRKNSFSWTEESTQAFLKLKKAVTNPPVLVLPNFTKVLMIECDTCGVGVGVVLMQQGRPLAYFSQALKGRLLHLSTYEKELYTLVCAVQKWRPYLVGQTFIIKTNQQSLKFLLEQRIGTLAQQKWLTKLLGYDFSIEYKRGKENRVADALSRRDEAVEEGVLTTFTFLNQFGLKN